MTIEINPKEDPSIDFTLEPEVQQVVDTETAIDASAALTLASGDVNTQTREREVSTITMHGKSDTFDRLSAEQQLERELELEEDAIDNATDPEMSDEEKVESLDNIATIAKDKTPRLYNEVVARELSKKLILPSQNDAMYQTAMHDYVARHSQLSNQFQEYIGKKMLESLGGDYDALEAIYDGFEMVVPFEFADKYVDWAKEFYGDSDISDRLLPGEIAHKFKTDLANQPTPELKLARFKDMIDSLAKVDGLWFADGNKMGMMFLANSIADPNFDPEHDFDWDRLIENVANVLDVTLVGGPVLRTVANPFKMINVVGRFNPRAGDALLTKALQKGQVEELGVKKSEVLAESHLPSSGRDTSIPDDLLGEVERIDNLINRAVEVGNKQALEYSVRRKLAIEEKIAAHDKGYARINMSRARRMTDKEVKAAKSVDGVKPNTVLTIRKGTSRLTGYKSTSSAIAAAKRGGYTDFKIMVNRAGEWIEYKKGMKKDPVDEFYYEAKVQEYIPEDSSFLSFKDMRPGAVMSFINPSWSRLTKDVYSLFGKEDALRLGSQTDVRSGIEAIINSANVHYGSLTVKSKNKVLRYLREMEETPNKRYTYTDLVENGLEGYDRLTKQEWLALEGIRRTSDAQHAITDLKIATELREAGYKSIRTVDGTNLYGKKVDKPESVVDDFEAILDVATGLGREKDADLIKMIKNGEVEIYKLRGKENLTESMTMGRGESSYVTDATHKYSYALVTRDSVKQVTNVPERGVLPYINNYVYRDYSNKFFIYKVDNRTHVDGKRVDKTSQEAATIVAAVDRRSDVQGMIDTIKGELSADEAKHITFDYRIGREYMEGLGDGEAAFENAKLSGLLHRGKRGPLLRSTAENAGNLRPVGAALQRSFNKLADNLAMDDFIRVAKQDFLRRYKDVLNLGKDADKFPMKLPPNLKGGKEWDEMAAAHEYIQFLGNMKDNVWRRKTMQWNFRMADWLDARGYKGRALYTASEIIATKVLTPDWIRSIPFLTAIVANPVRQFTMQALQHQLVASINPKLFLAGPGYKETYALLAGMMARHLDNADLRKFAKALKPKDQSVDEFLKDIEDLAESGLFEAVSTHHIAEGMVYLNRGLEGFEGGLALRGAQAQKALAAMTNAVKKVGFDSGEYFNLAATRVAARHHLKATKKGYTARDLNELSRAWAMGMNTGGKFMHQDVPFLNLFTQFFSFQQKSLAILRRAISETGGNQAFTKQQARRMAMIQVANYGAYGLGMSWLVNGIFDEIEQAAGAPVPETVRDIATYGATNYLINYMLATIYDEEEIPRINWGSVGAPFSGYTFLAESMYDTLMSEDEPTILAFLGASGMWLQKVDKNIENMFTAFNVMGVDPERDAELTVYALKNFGAIMSSGLSNYWKTQLVNGVHMLKDSSGDPVIELAASEVLAQKWLGAEISHGYWEVANDERAIEKEARAEGTRIANAFYATLKDHDDPIEVMQQIMSYTSLISDEYKRSAIRKAAVREFTDRMQMGQSKAKRLIEKFATQGVGSRDILSSRLLRLANTPEEKQMIREFLDVLFQEHSDPFSGEDE